MPSVDTIEYIRSLYYTVKGLCVIDGVPDNNSWPLRESLRLVVLGDLVGCMVDEKTGAIVCMVALFFGLWLVAVCTVGSLHNSGYSEKMVRFSCCPFGCH